MTGPFPCQAFLYKGQAQGFTVASHNAQLTSILVGVATYGFQLKPAVVQQGPQPVGGAFAETGFQESPLHDPGDLFARSMSHFWAGHMDLAM